MPTLDRAGFQLHYEVHGQGPAILLTHGFSATLDMWRYQVDELSRDHTLILWDMRGHGRSSSPEQPSEYSEAHTVQDMAALLDHLGFEQAVIGGLSLGGYMSMAFHAAHPERTRALLIIDTGPGYKNAEARARWNQTAEQTAVRIETEGAEALRAGSAERSGSRHDDLGGVVHAARGMLTQHDSRVIESLPEIRLPALVVVGADDEPFLAASSYMTNKIPGAEKVVIPGAGHAVNLDQPQAFNQALREFLTRRKL